MLKIGVDTGGTFTDLILYSAQDHSFTTHKRPSTPDDPSRGVLLGLQELLDKLPQHRPFEVIHGSTVATNAILEGKGAKTAFVTTAGFEDTLSLARQERPLLYALEPQKTPSPIPPSDCLGVDERLLFDGSVQRPLTQDSIDALLARLDALQVESVAVSLLHSYANPTHEAQLGRALREKLHTVKITLSHELLPEFREYERASTCVLNACVAPMMERYLRRLADGLQGAPLRIMASGGGNLPPSSIIRQPIHTVLSGPAGGLLGAKTMAQLAGYPNFITLDMGGTSTDVALVEGALQTTQESQIAGLPLRFPTLDIHTVGAGGGSIAWLDPGGALRVGPQSTGAEPGPACYGKQAPPHQPTVTDAHICLGHFQDKQLLGEQLTLDLNAAHTAMQPLSKSTGLTTEALSLGILRITEATMARAIQQISVQRGFDPRDFTLLPFGGAGGLHACRLAEELGINKILIPQHPGILSALGMLTSAPLYHYSRSLMLRVQPHPDGTFPPLQDLPALQESLARLHSTAHKDLLAEGIPPQHHVLQASLDLRYQGQSYELTIPMNTHEDTAAQFVARHLQLYGYTAQKPIELVTLRLSASSPPPTLAIPERINPTDKVTTNHFTSCSVYTEQGWQTWQETERLKLPGGSRWSGPLLIREYSSTTVVRPGWEVEVDPWGQLHLQRTAFPTKSDKGKVV